MDNESKLILARKFVDVLRDLGYKPRSYSGRNMFGRECVGVTLDSPGQLFKLGLQVGAHGDDDLAGCMTDQWVAQDSMGLSTIAYFPSLTWDDSMNVEDEE